MNASKMVILSLVLLFSVSACAEREAVVAVGPAKGETTVIVVKASSFRFAPRDIKAYQGSTLVFQIENVAGIDHNFTIKDPRGSIIRSVPLPAQKTITLKVDLSDTGLYEFYCDRPFHTTLGMTGRIEVVQAP